MKARLAMAALALGFAALSCEDNDSTAPALTALVFESDLTGDAMRPTAVDVPASGTGSFTVTTGTSTVFDPQSPERNIITYSVAVADLSGKVIEANIHGPADENSAGAILVPLTITSTDSVGLVIAGTFTATSNPAVSMDSLLVLLGNGSAYINITTLAHPGGEIRGQIKPQ